MLFQINGNIFRLFFRFSFCAKDGSSQTRFCNVADMPSSGVGLNSGNELHTYIAPNDGHQMPNDVKTLGSSYDRYLQNAGVMSQSNLFYIHYHWLFAKSYYPV